MGVWLNEGHRDFQGEQGQSIAAERLARALQVVQASKAVEGRDLGFHIALVVSAGDGLRHTLRQPVQRDENPVGHRGNPETENPTDF